EHLELDHPNGGLDLVAVFARLRQHKTIPTTLEYKQDSPAVYARQVRVFAGLWEDHAQYFAKSPSPLLLFDLVLPSFL
ncbi:hypothetical protein ACK11Z_13665, partial [Methanoculleus bourgensis]